MIATFRMRRSILSELVTRFFLHFLPFLSSLQNEPLFLRTYTEVEGEEEEDATLRLHNIVHSSLDVIGERKGEKTLKTEVVMRLEKRATPPRDS